MTNTRKIYNTYNYTYNNIWDVWEQKANKIVLFYRSLFSGTNLSYDGDGWWGIGTFVLTPSLDMTTVSHKHEIMLDLESGPRIKSYHNWEFEEKYSHQHYTDWQ